MGSEERGWRKKRYQTGRWVARRKISQYLALFAFIVLFLRTQRGSWNPAITELPFRLDPLAMLAHLLSSRELLAGSALALLTVGLTLVLGRVWCGWLCPLGTVLDLISPKRRGNRTGGPRESWRGVKNVLLLVILAAALFGNLTLLILDPLAILERSLAASLLPGLDYVITQAEIALYKVPLLSGPVTFLDAWLRPGILPYEPVAYRFAWFFGAFFASLVALNLAAPRFWCRYLCPLGGLLGLVGKFSWIRREVTPECKGCTLCTQACPTRTIDPVKGYASDPGECTMCLECLDACPRQSTAFRLPGKVRSILRLPVRQPYDPGRRQALYAFGGTIAAVALFKAGNLSGREHPFSLRPPGARENDLLAKCTRCGTCVRACPTAAIQPAISEAGLEGLWTPVIIPRLGYCDYACNACGQACPVQAIPALSLEQKQQERIGQAYIDKNRCIAWADENDCIVCEEMCPLPEKAIHLETAGGAMIDDGSRTLLLPFVDRERCIGCGICEYKCPVNGEAAIRVYVPEVEFSF